MTKPMQLLQSLGQVDDTYITEAAAPGAELPQRCQVGCSAVPGTGAGYWNSHAACLA